MSWTADDHARESRRLLDQAMDEHKRNTMPSAAVANLVSMAQTHAFLAQAMILDQLTFIVANRSTT